MVEHSAYSWQYGEYTFMLSCWFLTTLTGKNQDKAHKETLEGVAYVCCLDCGGDIVSVLYV